MRKLIALFAVSMIVLSSCQSKPAEDAANQQPAAETTNQTAEQQAAQPQQSAAPAGQDQNAVDKAIIEKYVADNGLKGKYTDSGIFYVIEKEGKGANPTVDNFVEVHYKGTLLDGNKFDSSYDRNQPAQFPLRGVVPGWQQGIPLFKEGGKGTIIIPSSLAYGPMGRPPVIPQNAVLCFDIELLKVMAAPAQK